MRPRKSSCPSDTIAAGETQADVPVSVSHKVRKKLPISTITNMPIKPNFSYWILMGLGRNQACWPRSAERFRGQRQDHDPSRGGIGFAEGRSRLQIAGK